MQFSLSTCYWEPWNVQYVAGENDVLPAMYQGWDSQQQQNCTYISAFHAGRTSQKRWKDKHKT